MAPGQSEPPSPNSAYERLRKQQQALEDAEKRIAAAKRQQAARLAEHRKNFDEKRRAIKEKLVEEAKSEEGKLKAYRKKELAREKRLAEWEAKKIVRAPRWRNATLRPAVVQAKRRRAERFVSGWLCVLARLITRNAPRTMRSTFRIPS